MSHHQDEHKKHMHNEPSHQPAKSPHIDENKEPCKPCDDDPKHKDEPIKGNHGLCQMYEQDMSQ
jgi:hypothetical protein